MNDQDPPKCAYAPNEDFIATDDLIIEDDLEEVSIASHEEYE